MVKYILTVAGTEPQTSDKLDKLMIDTVDICFKNGSFALLFDSVFNLDVYKRQDITDLKELSEWHMTLFPIF